jgi:uncharacterized protein (DUF2062 family)
MTGFNVYIAQVLKRVTSPIVKRLQTVLKCGLTPQKLALTLCIGTALGIMPLLWGTSLICILLAHIFRLNQVALQSVNYLLFPVQLALLVPFLKLGAWLLPWGPPLQPHMFAMMLQNPVTSLNILGWITLKSLAAWLVIVLPVSLLVYGVLLAIASRKVARSAGV